MHSMDIKIYCGFLFYQSTIVYKPFTSNKLKRMEHPNNVPNAKHATQRW